MSDVEQMNRIINCWALAEKRAKHLCAFETLGLNIRCRKPSQEEVKKAWRLLCMRLHPDKNVECDELATEATRCINLAKQHLFEVHFGLANLDYNPAVCLCLAYLFYSSAGSPTPLAGERRRV